MRRPVRQRKPKLLLQEDLDLRHHRGLPNPSFLPTRRFELGSTIASLLRRRLLPKMQKTASLHGLPSRSRMPTRLVLGVATPTRLPRNKASIRTCLVPMKAWHLTANMPIGTSQLTLVDRVQLHRLDRGPRSQARQELHRSDRKWTPSGLSSPALALQTTMHLIRKALVSGHRTLLSVENVPTLAVM